MRWIWIIALSMFMPSMAWAQLPIPQLDGNGPDVRIATDDELGDRIEAFLTRAERETTERLEEINQTVKTLQAMRAAHRAEANDPEAQAEIGFDPDLVDRLERALEREREVRTETLDLTKEARTAAQTVVTSPDGSIPLEDLVDQELTVRRLEDEVAADVAVAARLQGLIETDGPSLPPKPSLRDRIEREEHFVQRAQSEYARARAFERTARHRVALARVELWRRHVGVLPSEAESARNALARVEAARATGEQKITLERKTLRESSDPLKTAKLSVEEADRLREAARTLRRAELENFVRREDRLESEVLLARARLIATEALAKGELIELPPELLGRVTARIAKVDQDRSSIEVRMATIREQLLRARPKSQLEGLLRKQREVHERDLAMLLEIRQALRVVETLEQIAVTQRGPTHSPRALALAIAMTLLVLGGVILLLTFGMRLIRRQFTEGRFDGFLSRSKLLETRGEAIAVLLWPIVVLLGAAAIIIWPIWELELTPLEAVSSLYSPLFYVEDTGVSVWSVFELIATIWFTLVVSRFLRSFLQARIYQTFAWDIGLSNAINTFIHYGVMFVGVVIGLRFVGIGASSFALVAGVLGIGIGFGLRNITENFISGLIILAERPIKLGDFIDVGGQIEGQVKTIRARSTTVITRDNVSVIIPNSEFVGGRVTNWSHGDPKVRVAIPVGVAYGSDTDLVRKQLLEAGARHGQVLKKPHPEVQFRAFGGSSLDFCLFVWIEEQQHRFRIESDLHFAVDKAFRKVGIEIAFPQMDLHLKSIAAPVRAFMAPVPEPAEDETSVTMELPVSQRVRVTKPPAGPKGTDR